MALFIGFLLVLTIHITCSSKVAFYESNNFIGLITETISNESCANPPHRAYDKANSLTTESCIMLYTGENCSSTSIKLAPRSYPNLANVSHGFGQHFGNAIKSFHTCNQNVGSSDTATVKFYEDNDMIAEYSQICGCTTLPEYTRSVTRVENHGVCLRLYLGQLGAPPDCTESYHTLHGGTSYISENLRNLTHTATSWKRIMAISPCSNELTTCVKLYAKVIKFEIDSDPKQVAKLSSSSDMSMSVSTTFRNNGSARVSEEYTATKLVTEATETSLVKGYSSLDCWTVETGVTTEFTADIPLVSKSTVTASLTSAYTREEGASVEEGEIRRRETTQEFSVSQRIEIEPCTEYKVNSFIRMVHNYPVNYKVYSRVSGMAGERKLTAAELKERLEGLEYVQDHDDFSIIAMGHGTMFVDYGVETVIDGEGAQIPSCWGDADNDREILKDGKSKMSEKKYDNLKMQSSASGKMLCEMIAWCACLLLVTL